MGGPVTEMGTVERNSIRLLGILGLHGTEHPSHLRRLVRLTQVEVLPVPDPRAEPTARRVRKAERRIHGLILQINVAAVGTATANIHPVRVGDLDDLGSPRHVVQNTRGYMAPAVGADD